MLRIVPKAAVLAVLASPLAVILAACSGSTDPADWDLDESRWEGTIISSLDTNTLVLEFDRSIRSPDGENPITGNVVPHYYVDFYRHIGTPPNAQLLFHTDDAFHEGADIYHPHFNRVGWQAHLDSETEMTVWDADAGWEATVTRTN